MEVHRTDRPDRQDPDHGLGEAEHAIAGALERRIPRITERWHQALVSHLNVRPQAVFPGEDLLDHMPGVVQHVISFVEANGDTSEGTLEALRSVAAHWRTAGYSIEESLLHFRILNRVLHEELRSLLEESHSSLPATAAARIAESLSHGSTLIQAVVVGCYRDREEEHFGEFVSVLAHEVRGPISAGLAALQMLVVLEEREAGTQTERLRRQAFERLDGSFWQVRDVLDAVKKLVMPSSPEAEPERREPVAEIVSTVMAEFRAAQDAVRLEANEGIPEVAIPYHPVILVLHNLVQNAVAYSDPEKPDRWVRLTCGYEEETDRWLLRVRDNGVGIAESEQELIFHRFRRGREARGPGHGLGLSIAREAARRIKGDVWVESTPGEGSTFTFAVPAEKAWALSTAG
jgi:signal transduction histidine kinase